MSITAIILTFNEELHIERCIKSIKPLVKDIFVVDSYSDDDTIEKAKKLGANVYKNKFINQATQFNWALENCPIKTGWVWRIDADEYADKNLINKLKDILPGLSKDITGIYVKRGIVFYGKLLKFGTWSPRWNLKIFRYKVGYCENRWMDEHIKLKYGNTVNINGLQIDDNRNDLTWWTQKHNNYATREMIDMFMLNYRYQKQEVKPKLFGNEEQRKRWLKLRYAGIPLFIRPFFNFIYRYFLRLGFLDGIQGFIWHILQGFWYRMLVDAKIWEIKRRFNNNSEQIIKYLDKEYNIFNKQ
jgi:glycosyltransferase involved in cell wall biosynthesis